MKTNLYPCFWFNQQAQEAAEYYCSIFPNSKIISTNALVTMFELDNNLFMALNGKVDFEFNESVSYVINCDTQDEIDYYWEKLSQGGSEGRCGWLKDKYGFSWQVVPSILGTLMSDSEKAPRVIQAFMKMSKFEIEKLLNA